MGLKEAVVEAKRIVKGEDEAGGRLSDPCKIPQEVSSVSNSALVLSYGHGILTIYDN